MDCQITLTMDKLLNLVPRFREAVEIQIWSVDRVEIPTNFVESSMGPSDRPLESGYQGGFAR